MGSSNDILWNHDAGFDFSGLAATYATPFYLYDADGINSCIEAIRQAFENRVKVFYAVKANPNLELLRAVLPVADGLDISSGGELHQALTAGFNGANMSFAGPAKTYTELSDSIENGVGCISIESLRELNDCLRIARETGTKAQIVMRINPEFLNRSFGLKMGGRAVQFGIDEENIAEIVAVIETNLEHLVFQGIHIYSGSQCFDTDGIVEGVENTFRIVGEIEGRSGLKCRTVNLGGGFGYSHTKPDTYLDIVELAVKLLPTIRKFTDDSDFEREIVFELGRYLTAPAGIYVTKVISTKESRGKQYYMVDGGLNHHLAAAGTFGAAMRSNFIVRNLTRLDAELVRCQLAGPSCNPTDLLGVDIELPRPEIGDLIGVLNSGSYGYTSSPLLFLGRPTPAELVYGGGQVRLGRRSRTILDFN